MKARQAYIWLIGMTATLLLSLTVMLNAYLKDTINRVNRTKGENTFVSNYYEEDHTSVNWLENLDPLAGKDHFILEEIGKGYSEAIRLWNNALFHRSIKGLEIRFSDEMIDKINNQLLSEKNFVRRTAINHNLTLKFISEDRTVVSITDDDATFVYQEFSSEGHVYSAATINLQILMIFMDGRWKILEVNEEKREKSDLYLSRLPLSMNEKINGINYYPSDHPWKKFWAQYDTTVIDKDLKVISELEFNSIRIFLPSDFSSWDKYQDFLQRSRDHNLKAMICLFDFPKGYELTDFPYAFTYLRAVHFHSEPYAEYIIAYDLKNEPDLDYDQHGKDNVDGWLDFCAASLKQMGSKIPITVGWSNSKFIKGVSENLDFLSFHHYDSPSSLETFISSTHSQIDKPLAITEYGMSTYESWWYPQSKNYCDQETYISSIQDVVHRHGLLGHMVWTYQDFIELPRDIFGWKPWVVNPQAHYGIMTKSGRQKSKLACEIVSFQWTITSLLIIILLSFLIMKLWKFRKTHTPIQGKQAFRGWKNIPELIRFFFY